MHTLPEYLRSGFIYSCFLQVPPPKAVSVQEILRVGEELVDVLKEESRCTLFARYLCYLVAVPASFLVAVCLYFLLSLFLNRTNYRHSFPITRRCSGLCFTGATAAHILCYSSSLRIKAFLKQITGLKPNH